MIVRLATILALSSTACGGPADRRTGGQTDGRTDGPGAGAPAIVFLGTSLTAGYGLSDPSLAYPGLIQAKLDSAGRPFRVVNAGISGES